MTTLENSTFEFKRKYIMGRDLGKDLIDILNLPKRTSYFSIEFNVNDVVRINCEYFLALSYTDIEKLKATFSLYKAINTDKEVVISKDRLALLEDVYRQSLKREIIDGD